VHVDETLLAGSAGKSAKWLRAEHSIVSCLFASLAHNEIVEILELFLVNLESLARVCLVSKLLGQCLYDITQSILKCLVHLREVCLRVE